MHGQIAQTDLAYTTYQELITDICNLNWRGLTRDDLINIAWAYFYFSVQFRENLEIARELYPDDIQLQQLDYGERDTDNLSPWPGVADSGERMNHDEFMNRTLKLTIIAKSRRRRLDVIGQSFLANVRAIDKTSRALSIASYEDGGLERVFQSMLKAGDWEEPLLQAFRHFLSEHIRFDSDPEQGHGALCRHLTPDDRVLPLWRSFRHMLVEAAPALLRSH
jgi:hypothetical protein